MANPTDDDLDSKETLSRWAKRRGVLKLMGTGLVSNFAVGSATASDDAPDRPATKYAGGGSIESAEELATAITTDSFWAAVEDITFVGNFAQGEVYSGNDSFGEFPLDGDAYGIISSGIAKNVIDSGGNDLSTYFGSSPSNDIVPASPDGHEVNDPAAIQLTFTVPEAQEVLRFAYAFGTQEIPSYVGSAFQDFFVAELEYPDGESENIAILPDGNPVTVDNVEEYTSSREGSSLNAVSETFTNEVDVSDYQGAQLSLTLAVADATDSSLDSAAFIDEVGFESAKQRPEGADLTGVTIADDSSSYTFGEADSSDWVVGDSSPLYYEFFTLQPGNDAPVPSYEYDGKPRTFNSSGIPGLEYGGALRYDIGTTTINVSRDVVVHAQEDVWQIDYQVLNSGSEPSSELSITQYADFDLGMRTDDTATYDSANDIVYVEGGADGGVVGYTAFDISGGRRSPAVHYVGEYDAYKTVLSGDLNGEPLYPADGSTGDPVTALQWNVGPLGTGDTAQQLPQAEEFSVVFAMADTVDALRDKLSSRLEVQDPTIEEFSPPPSAIEVDDSPNYSMEIAPGSFDAADIDVVAEVEEYKMGESVGSFTDQVSGLIEGNIRAVGDLPQAADRSSEPEGYGYELTVNVTVDGRTKASKTVRSFAFTHVNTIAVYPVKVSGTSPPKTGADLRRDLREKFERANEYFASTLSTMGAHGMEFRIETDPLSSNDTTSYEDGWLPLRQTDLPNRGQMRTNATNYIEDNDSVPQYGGNQTTLMFLYEPQTGLGGGTYYPNDMAQDNNGWPFWSRVVADFEGDHWLHELTHRMGMPDINGGNPNYLGEWGIMASGDAVTNYIRAFWDGQRWTRPAAFPDEHPDYEWLTPAKTELTDDSVMTVSLAKREDKRVGDDMTYLGIKLQQNVIDRIIGVITLQEEQKYFFPEARDARSSAPNVLGPGGNQLVENPDPVDVSGIALYNAGRADPSKHPPNDEFLQYIPPSGQASDVTDDDTAAITLAQDPSASSEHAASYYDPDTATELSIDPQTFDIDNPSVTVNRSTNPSTSASSTNSSATFSVDRVTEVADDLFDVAASSEIPPIPQLDITVSTPDGATSGFDPDSGEYVNEINGAFVSGTLGNSWVSVPLEKDVEVSVSDTRLREWIADHSVDAPEQIEYNQQIILERDPSFRSEDGVAVMEGRVVRRSTASISESSSGQVTSFLQGEATLEPASINARSNGDFVTAQITLDGDISPPAIDHGAFVLGTVPAISDDRYGFVQNPPTERRAGKTRITIKFDRQAVIDEFGTGTAEAVITGDVGGNSVFAPVSFSVFSPGNGGGNGAHNGNPAGNGNGQRNGNGRGNGRGNSR